MIIAVDFDGTVVDHKYPSIGKEKPFACETLRQLAADGHRLILWTVRSGQLLQDALDWCAERGVSFYAVNSAYPHGSLTFSRQETSPKIEADIYLDDHNLGGLPDWGEIYQQISGKAMAREQKRRRRSLLPRWMRKLKHH